MLNYFFEVVSPLLTAVEIRDCACEAASTMIENAEA